MSESHLWIGLSYVERNSCRAGIAASPEQYRWSSAAAHLGLAGIVWVCWTRAFWSRSGGAETWRQMHASEVDRESEQHLRRATYSGRPFGDTQFMERLELEFQRKWSRWPEESRAVRA